MRTRTLTYWLAASAAISQMLLVAHFIAASFQTQVKSSTTGGPDVTTIPDYAQNTTIVLLSPTVVDVLQGIVIGGLALLVISAAYQRSTELLVATGVVTLVVSGLFQVTLFDWELVVVPTLGALALLIALGLVALGRFGVFRRPADEEFTKLADRPAAERPRPYTGG